MYRAPSRNELARMMDLVKYVIFPDYSDVPIWIDGTQAVRSILEAQMATIMEPETVLPSAEPGKAAPVPGLNAREPGKAVPSAIAAIAADFIDSLSEIGRILATDVEAVLHNDPAVTDPGEVILCYPLVKVMLNYRVAHRLYELGVPRIPRMLTEMAHSETGIDIHPAAVIGEYFAIDHGTGVVIGATSIIGRHCMLYQGVTLGARNFSYDSAGHPVNEPRHPILEDNVTVYSNTSILGRVRIGHDSIIGGNLWLTHDVPAGTKVLQARSVQIPSFDSGAGI